MSKTHGAKDKSPRAPRPRLNPRRWRDLVQADPERLHTLQVSLPAELLATCETFAETENIALSAYLRRAVTEWQRAKQIV